MDRMLVWSSYWNECEALVPPRPNNCTSSALVVGAVFAVFQGTSNGGKPNLEK